MLANIFKRKQFHEMINDNYSKLQFEDELREKVKDAERLLEKHSDRQFGPYRVVITIESITWRSLLWQLACMLDQMVTGPQGTPYAGSSSNGVRYDVKINTRKDTEDPKPFDPD